MKPIRFTPINKQTIWGGNRILPFKGQEVGEMTQIGESWELSGVPGDVSVVCEGEHQGKNLQQLITIYKERLVGKSVYERFGDEFPLLIKFIDADQPLSIQVHPDDETARKLGKTRGKTEMWYVVDAHPGSTLKAGFNTTIDARRYKEMIQDDTICDVITEHQVHPGDCFFIPAGKIHSIGKGCLLLEIQQTSDVTYRIYDFKRKDAQGRYRELHTEEAAQSLDFREDKQGKTHYIAKTGRGVTLVRCPYFSTTLYRIDDRIHVDTSHIDSFIILICTSGEATISTDDESDITLRKGQTILIPAENRYVDIRGNAEIIETYI